MTNHRAAVLASVISLAFQCHAQDTTAVTQIDPSKPTNLYTQVNIAPEYTSAKGYELLGVRSNVQYAFNTDNLLLVEVPILHNTGSNEIGLSDVRTRYFNKFKNGISERVAALVAGIDVTLPTGSAKKGLGTGSYSIAPTLIAGIMLTPRIFAFPGVSYVHITAAEQSDPEIATYASNGFGVQSNISISFSQRTFLFANPIYTYLVTNGRSSGFWSADLNLNRVVRPNKLKVNMGWSPNFTAGTNALRAGFTVFL